MSDTQEPTGDISFLEGNDPNDLNELAEQGIGEGDFDDDPCYTPALTWPEDKQ